MKEKRNVEFRYYDIPPEEDVLVLTGPVWNKAYGEGPERLHFHNYYEVGICSDGEGEMTLGEETVHFVPGCISLIPQTELHTTNTYGEMASWEWMYYDIYKVLEGLYPDDELTRDNIRFVIDRQGKLLTPDMDIQKMQFLIRDIYDEMQQKEYLYRDMVRHLLTMLTVEIIRKLSSTEMLPEHTPPRIDIMPAIEYIKENYASPIRIASLAEICSMSESFFRKTFEKYMNMKPLDYVNFVRIQKSCALLRSSAITVSDAAGQVGYESVSSFIRNFRRITGSTPHQWRVDEESERNQFLKYNVTALRGWLE